MSSASPGDARATPVRLHRFAILSGIGWLIDFTIFNSLAWSGVPLFTANLIGAICGVSFVFVTGRRYIFHDVRSGLLGAVAAYVAWNAIAVFFMSLAVAWLGHVLAQSSLTMPAAFKASLDFPLRAMIPAAAKILLTPISMYLNYVAMGVIIEQRFRFL